MPMKTSEKIIKFLREHGIECPDDVEIRRTRAGYWQRSAGAWSWYLWSDTGWAYNLRIGSQHFAKQVAKGFTIYRYLDTITLDPEEDES